MKFHLTPVRIKNKTKQIATDGNENVGKGNPYSLLVGKQTATVTVKIDTLKTVYISRKPDSLLDQPLTCSDGFMSLVLRHKYGNMVCVLLFGFFELGKCFLVVALPQQGLSVVFSGGLQWYLNKYLSLPSPF